MPSLATHGACLSPPALPTCPPACAFPPCRHDYCGVQEDLRNWWPKLRRGGIFAGHDYLTADSPPVLDTKQDWSRECTAVYTASVWCDAMRWGVHSGS